MKITFGSTLLSVLRKWLLWRVLLLAWIPASAAFAKPTPPQKTQNIVLGMVGKPGKYLLEQPTTIGAAFKAAGGWKGCSSKGCWPPKYCILKIKNNQGVYGEKFKITIKVDLDTGEVIVTDPEWQTYPLPDSSWLEMPHSLF